MKKCVLIALSVMLTCILFLCACRQEPEPSNHKIMFFSEINVLLKSGKKEILNWYESDYFRKDARVFDKDLALLSYALAASTSSDNAVKTLEMMMFDGLVQHWNDDDHINGCSYVIGRRKVDGHNLVAVYIKGIGYSVEWAGNMMMGASGNHYGFEAASSEVYDALKGYIAENNLEKDLKLWITGYSRGAAITDALAYDIITQEEIKIGQKDLFVYAFEPPASIASDAIEAYKCIHNFFVEADLVASIPPAIPSADYGLSRPGVDLKMSFTVDSINDSLHKYVGPDVSMPEFTSADDYADPAEFLTYFIKGATSATEAESAASLESRDKFYSTIQDRLTYLVTVLMKGNRAGLNALMQYISDHKDQLLTIVSKWLTQTDGFYDDLKKILDSCGTEYVDEDLKTACSLLPSLYLNKDLEEFLLEFMLDSSKITNAKYLICCHYPEVGYALLKGYPRN